jgi:hypothetical protein
VHEIFLCVVMYGTQGGRSAGPALRAALHLTVISHLRHRPLHKFRDTFLTCGDINAIFHPHMQYCAYRWRIYVSTERLLIKLNAIVTSQLHFYY